MGYTICSARQGFVILARSLQRRADLTLRRSIRFDPLTLSALALTRFLCDTVRHGEHFLERANVDAWRAVVGAGDSCRPAAGCAYVVTSPGPIPFHSTLNRHIPRRFFVA
ncbi:MAG: hypothetical protein IT323_18120 [Anaerolineae bacterium]|nr:hypothetical protein [Anaerolineae bacterium]